MPIRIVSRLYPRIQHHFIDIRDIGTLETATMLPCFLEKLRDWKRVRYELRTLVLDSPERRCDTAPGCFLLSDSPRVNSLLSIGEPSKYV